MVRPLQTGTASPEISGVPNLEVLAGGGEGTSMPVYSHTVDDWQELDVRYRPTQGVAQMVTSLVTMSDGSQNIVRELEPIDRKFAPVFETGAPLGTRTKGYVTYLGIQAAKNGMRARLVGAPQNPTDDPHLSHQSYGRVQITKTGQERDGEEGMVAMYFGYSQPGMMGAGVAHYAKEAGVELPVVVTEDQCLAVGRNWEVTRQDMTLAYIGRELLAAGKGLATHALTDSPLRGLRRLQHIAGSIGFTPTYLRTHSRITQALWEGEAGLFVEHIPDGTVFVAHFRTESPFNDRKVYGSKIRRLPLGRVIEEHGYHLTAIDRNITLGHVSKMTLAQKMYEQGTSLEDIADALDYPLTPTK